MESEEHEEGEGMAMESESKEGEAMPMEMDMGRDEHHGFMVMTEVAQDVTVIEFTVPQGAVGEWEFACFEEDGDHYDEGMHGKLIVKAP